MVSAVLVSSDKRFFTDLSSGNCEYIDLNISRAASGKEVLSMISKDRFDLVVADEWLSDMTGLELIKILVGTDPTIHCAVVSSLPAKAFHEASEGLGIIMQIPPRPGKIHMENLLQHLNRILNRSMYS